MNGTKADFRRYIIRVIHNLFYYSQIEKSIRVDDVTRFFKQLNRHGRKANLLNVYVPNEKRPFVFKQKAWGLHIDYVGAFGEHQTVVARLELSSTQSYLVGTLIVKIDSGFKVFSYIWLSLGSVLSFFPVFLLIGKDYAWYFYLVGVLLICVVLVALFWIYSWVKDANDKLVKSVYNEMRRKLSAIMTD